jgi:hypothetical protein
MCVLAIGGLLFAGAAIAEEISGVITKVDGNKITFYKATFNKDTKKLEKGDEQTFTATDSVKVVKGKFNKDTKKLEAGDAIEGGLKSDTFTKIDPDKGVRATVTVDDKKCSQIIIAGGKKGK